MEESMQKTEVIDVIKASKSYKLPVIITILLITTLVGGYYWNQNKSNVPTSTNTTESKATSNASDLNQSSVPKTSEVAPSTQTPSDWQVYIDQQTNFTVKYPKNWESIDGDSIGFSPTKNSEDTLWTISSYPITSNFDEIESKIGSEYTDKIAQASLFKNSSSKKIEKYVVTSPSNPNFYSETIIFKDSSNYYFISNGGISNENLAKKTGVPAGTTFEQFYQSFKLTDY